MSDNNDLKPIIANNMISGQSQYMWHSATITMPKQDFDILQKTIILKENKIQELEQKNLALNNTIDQLRSNADQLRPIIEKNNNEIDLLKTENAELKDRLRQLETNVLKLNINIENMNQKMTDDKHMSKLIMALQDVNAHQQLENNLGKPLSRLMYKLRSRRVEDCHYLLTSGSMIDTPELIDYKLQQIKNKLEELSPSLKSKFEKKIGRGLIEGVINHLDQLSYTSKQPATNECAEADEWWID